VGHSAPWPDYPHKNVFSDHRKPQERLDPLKDDVRQSEHEMQLSRRSRITRSKQSKAAERSNSPSNVTYCRAAAVKKSDQTEPFGVDR